MEQYTFQAKNGLAVVFGRPYILRDIQGLGIDGLDTQLQKAPFQDGKTHLDSLLNERTVQMTVTLTATTRAELMTLRANIFTVFNPKLGVGTFIWERDDGIYTLDAVVSACTAPGGKAAAPLKQDILITLICPDPYWKTAADASASQLTGGMSFPVSFPISFATVVTATMANNTGDVATPITITVQGPAVNPKIHNQTVDKFLRVVYSVAAGEQLRIKTGFGVKEVTHISAAGVETNVMNWLTADSEFWFLEPGTNQIAYTEEGGNVAAVALLAWQSQFIGR